MAAATAEREDWAAARKDALRYAHELGALLDAIRNTMAGMRKPSPKPPNRFGGFA